MPLLHIHKWQYVFIFYSFDQGWCKKVHALYFKKSIGGAVEEGNEKLSENYGPTMVDE